ncbi:hypothetical protein CH260_23040 [Rhodococcus sp. 05-2256-B2]|uniref:hypothetical protein n=1 Tax=Nocardiaceae TaxID=85025 RepID=UPI00050C90E0|nr:MULTISPECIES: hypothetical protein [Rhodococcus]OZD32495.1 hypothetical protein CH252_39080 [Rhodococcus sp. 06-1477-1B]OZD56384.1 hypothetical protein CH266_00315 [Rhodococcus sp. 06-1474-1B]OZD86809.1 hypothetical protein CH258_11800 [Rhodococcus sp. 05-2256-B4]OZD91235.1 hypothetical protein CH260_23040 [Rhodococcus sp. 05-2256-B2]OZD95798.1 hypothetical protein CH285_25965 [Rhodococcus sp. 05-2256-B1]
MDRPSGKGLVAVLGGVGAATGAAAAVVWHVAITEPPDTPGTAHLRPSWFPVSLYLVAAGVALAVVVAWFLVDSGMRVVRDRQYSSAHLFTLLIVVGAALGAGSAFAWTHWPPQQLERAPDPAAAWARYIVIHSGATEVPQSSFGTAPADISGIGIQDDEGYVGNLFSSDAAVDDASPSTFTPIIGSPWTVFPVGGVVLAAVAAWTLSLRDFRLTAVSRSDPDAL